MRNPKASSLLNILSKFRGCSAYVVPMEDSHGRPLGNNGDALMLRVFEKRLQQLEIAQVPQAKADIIIVPPNGAMLDRYQFPSLLTNKIASMKDLPLVIFPSSAYFRETNPSEIFSGGRSEVLWILREPKSFDHLTGRWGESLSQCRVELVLDHDVVASEGSEISEYFPAVEDRGYVLVAARLDTESRFSSRTHVHAGRDRGLLSLAKRAWLAAPQTTMQTRVNRLLAQPALAANGRALERQVSAEAARFLREVWELPHVYLDVSSPRFCTYHEYREMIAKASAVISDRLHVGMPAGLLGKPTVISEGSYHKLRGVYEHSLAGIETMQFLP